MPRVGFEVKTDPGDRGLYDVTLVLDPMNRGQGAMTGYRQARVASQLIAFMVLSASTAPASAAPPFMMEAICRTAIASVTGRDPKIMQVTRTSGEVLFLTYVRPIDNFVWAYRCRIEGNRVVWATEPGRWREGPKDDEILFETVDAGKQLRIIENHRDGTSTKQLFDRDAIL